MQENEPLVKKTYQLNLVRGQNEEPEQKLELQVLVNRLPRKEEAVDVKEKPVKEDENHNEVRGINFGVDDLKTFKFWRAIIAEFFGATFFLFCVTTVCQPRGQIVDPSARHMEIGIGIGLAIATTAMMVGHVSGGHLNPAVTLGMIFGGRISVLQGLLYIPAQLVGAIVGTAFTYELTRKPIATLGETTLATDLSPAQGFGLELLFTLILVFFVFSITDPAKKVDPAAACLGIGVAIWVCHVCLIGYTGCGINPARSFGPAVFMKNWDNHWVYWIGPCAGALLAAILYCVVFCHMDDEAAQ